MKREAVKYSPLTGATSGGETSKEGTSGEQYELGRVLSREKECHTFEATLKNDEEGIKKYRICQIFNAASDRMKADKAIGIVNKLKDLSHCNVLSVVDSYIKKNEDFGSRDLFVVYEDNSGMSLAQKLGENSFETNLSGGLPALEPSDLNDLFFSLLCALEYLHSKDTPHMDLNPDNILLSNSFSDIVVTNYGLSSILNVNSFEYIAPEVHRRQSIHPDMAQKVDIWAVCLSFINAL